MTNVELMIEDIIEELKRAARYMSKNRGADCEEHIIEAKEKINKTLSIMDGCEICDVCRWCGEESEDDHPAAICMKG